MGQYWRVSKGSLEGVDRCRRNHKITEKATEGRETLGIPVKV